jgi:hypothetical protein
VLSTGRIIGRKDTLSDATYAGKGFLRPSVFIGSAGNE